MKNHLMRCDAYKTNSARQKSANLFIFIESIVQLKY